MQRRGAVRRQWHVEGEADGGHREQAGDPAAARGIRHSDVDRARLEHAAEVCGLIAVLAVRDVHPSRTAVAQQTQALHVLRGKRLLHPAHIEPAREHLHGGQRLLSRVRAVRIDEERRVADCITRRTNPDRVAARVAADFHLDARNSLVHPTPELRAQLSIGVGSESAAAVDREVVPDRAEQLEQGKPEETCLQVPQRRVDGRDRHRADARSPEVAHAPDHR